jgi:ankyrin repeat protein
VAAATAGHAGVVRVLLARGANVATKDRDGGSAILNAVFFGYRDAVAELLKYKHNIDPDNLSEAMLIAAGMGHTDIVRDLIQNQVSVNVAGLHQRTPLMAAVKFGRLDAVRVLLQSGGDLTAKDDEGQDVAALAQQQGDDAIVELISKAAEAKTAAPPTESETEDPSPPLP